MSPQVGLFGLIGSGNSGNDASTEAVLAYLRTAHPEVVVDAMCGGPEQVRARYGIDGVPISWYQKFEQRKTAVPPVLLKVLGKFADTFRTARWVRQHDAVIVPGAGALETTLPQHAWGYPYSLFVVSLSGKIFGTKVALVSVGAEVGSERLTRWLFTAAGRFAFYRSYRDELSRDAMEQQGLDTSRDRVYPDLAFGLAVPSSGPGAERTVGIGLMDYYGNDDSHGQPDEVRASYVEKMKSFTRWLVDNGRRVRLFVGDTNNADETIVEKILADLRTHRPDLDPTWVVADPVVTFADLMQAMEPAGIVVATRYHNVVCALMLSKPTISIGYGEKNAVLMAGSGLGEYCQSVDSLDVERLITQFTELERHAARLRQRVTEGNAAKVPLVEDQLAELSAVLFRTPAPARSPADPRK